MGAFLLASERAAKFNLSGAVEVIRQQCRSEPVRFVLRGWSLFLFPKTLSGRSNYAENNSCAVYSTGTPFIAGCDHEQSLKRKLAEVSDGLFNGDDLRGLFWMLIREGEKLSFITDRSGHYPLYHTAEGDIVSSSFLGICNGLGTLSPDRESMVENLLSGTLTGRDTLFREVKRFDPQKPFSFRGIRFIAPGNNERFITDYYDRSDSIDSQVEILDDWFAGMKPMAESYGTDAGITGGLDSRLLFALCRRHLSKEVLQFHSHFRKREDIDYSCGREISEKSGMKFVSAPTSDLSDDGPDLVTRMHEGMLFNDGQVRTHSFWHEEFNTASYRIKTLNEKRLGLNGIGGEQYRNMERLLFPSRSFRQWVRFDLVDKYSGNIVAGKKIRDELADRISSKIAESLGINVGSAASLSVIKRYMNEVYNPSNRMLRASHENRLSYFLSPFADAEVSLRAYGIIPHLGLSLGYEAELIKRIDPDVASFNSAYRFRFSEREPLPSIIPGLLFNNFLPRGMQSALYELASARTTDRWENLYDPRGHSQECLGAVESFNLPLSVRELVRRTDLGPLVFAMGHLLITFNGRITVR